MWMDYTTNTLAYEALFLAATAGDSGCLKEHKDRSTEVDTPGISLHVCLRRRCLKRVFCAFPPILGSPNFCAKLASCMGTPVWTLAAGMATSSHAHSSVSQGSCDIWTRWVQKQNGQTAFAFLIFSPISSNSAKQVLREYWPFPLLD